MSERNPHFEQELREFSKVSRSAFPLVFHRTFYGIPYAQEMSDLVGARQIAAELHGSDLRGQYEVVPILEARYKGGEAAIDHLIAQYPNARILELAAGLSLHGLTLAQKHPKLEYIETDYQNETVHLKQRLLKEELLHHEQPNLHFASANALRFQDLQQALSATEQDRPLVVYNEGLISYFNEAEKDQLAENIKALLQGIDGAWVTPDPSMAAERRKMLLELSPGYRGMIGSAEKVAGQKYDDHGFASEADADQYFERHGFVIEKLPQPTDLHSFEACNLDPEYQAALSENISQHGKVWVVRLPGLNI